MREPRSDLVNLVVETSGFLAVVASGVAWAVAVTVFLVRIDAPPDGYEPYHLFSLGIFFLYLALPGFPCAALVAYAVARGVRWPVLRAVLLVNAAMGAVAAAAAMWFLDVTP